MTVKLVVLFTPPEDADAFERHYRDVHVPLVRSVPGLVRFEAGRLTAAPDRGELTYSRIAELYFDDQDALKAATRSAEGRAMADDFQELAPAGTRVFVSVLDD
jgi:uncharacterized protein (TIGR02118 family)